MEKKDFPFWRRQKNILCKRKKKCIWPVYDVNKLILIKGALGSNGETGCLLNVVLKICTGTTGFYSFIKLKKMCLDIVFGSWFWILNDDDHILHLNRLFNCPKICFTIWNIHSASILKTMQFLVVTWKPFFLAIKGFSFLCKKKY